MQNLAVIGSGITGALTVNILKRLKPEIKITVLEKARGVGGRMSTTRCPSNQKCLADLGAQYLTIGDHTFQTHIQYYDELIESKLLRCLKGSVDGMRQNDSTLVHYVCPNGSGSIIKHYIRNTDSEVHFGEKVTEILANERTSQWIIKTDRSTKEGYDAIVLTIPVPQIFQLKGTFMDFLGEEKHHLNKVGYCSRYALGLFYNQASKHINGLPWEAKYVENNSVIRFISVDNRKRNMPSELPALVVHSTKEFGRTHLEDDKINVQNLMLSNLNEIIPNLPPPSHIKCHKWRYSQVERSYPGNPGCLILSKRPLLVCGGDGFSSSTFDGCIYSAEKTAETVIKNF